jgi:hypothetical protein
MFLYRVISQADVSEITGKDSLIWTNDSDEVYELAVYLEPESKELCTDRCVSLAMTRV